MNRYLIEIIALVIWLSFHYNIILHNDFNKEFTENIRQVPSDWLIILLGAGVNQLDSSSNKINKNIYKCRDKSMCIFYRFQAGDGTISYQYNPVNHYGIFQMILSLRA